MLTGKDHGLQSSANRKTAIHLQIGEEFAPLRRVFDFLGKQSQTSNSEIVAEEMRGSAAAG